MKKKSVKEVKMLKFLVCAYKSQYFGQSQKFFARSHDRETVTFRNSACRLDSLALSNSPLDRMSFLLTYRVP